MTSRNYQNNPRTYFRKNDAPLDKRPVKSKEEELNTRISELETSISSLKESLANEVSEKIYALECHKTEKEARMAAEKNQDSLKELLGKAEQNVSEANGRVNFVEDSCKILQQFIAKLQNELKEATDANKQVEHHNLLVKKKDCRPQLSQAQICGNSDFKGFWPSHISRLLQENSTLETLCSYQSTYILLLRRDCDALKQKLEMADLSSSEIRTEYEEQKRIVSELQERLRDSETQLLEGESLRKKLHNTIVELKGNIRVFCRVRPSLPDDGHGAEPTIYYPTSVELAGRGIVLNHSSQKHSFTFDKVFAPDASQQEVFMEISELVQSALDGYKVCIFAYGQTGSGKTYTIMGRPEAPEQKGLIPRSLEQVFQTSQALAAKGWKYKMQVSILEIYNETIHDLLLPRSSSRDVSIGGAGKQQYAIRHDADGNTYVSDLTIVDVCSTKEVLNLLQQAACTRSVGKTDMNEVSSRSHLVFTLRIYGEKESTEQVKGVLNLIDLAGSERLTKSRATGERLMETKAINTSLLALSEVILALANKGDHVPFRNSKLTYLLQPCLGGGSKTLMCVNVSPDPSSTGESLCSLKFATRVNSCEIGIPRRVTIRSSEKEPQSTCRKVNRQRKIID